MGPAFYCQETSRHFGGSSVRTGCMYNFLAKRCTGCIKQETRTILRQLGQLGALLDESPYCFLCCCCSCLGSLSCGRAVSCYPASGSGAAGDGAEGADFGPEADRLSRLDRRQQRKAFRYRQDCCEEKY